MVQLGCSRSLIRCPDERDLHNQLRKSSSCAKPRVSGRSFPSRCHRRCTARAACPCASVHGTRPGELVHHRHYRWALPNLEQVAAV